jgi:hypothetical protein
MTLAGPPYCLKLDTSPLFSSLIFEGNTKDDVTVVDLVGFG